MSGNGSFNSAYTWWPIFNPRSFDYELMTNGGTVTNGLTEAEADLRYLRLIGGSLTGALYIPASFLQTPTVNLTTDSVNLSTLTRATGSNGILSLTNTGTGSFSLTQNAYTGVTISTSETEIPTLYSSNGGSTASIHFGDIDFGFGGSVSDVDVYAGGNVVATWDVNGLTMQTVSGATSNALLNLTSTSQGVLFPRMTNTQMLAIAAPSDGLLVYNTTNHAVYYYDGNLATWSALSGGSSFMGFADGSVGSPSIYFTSDPNTGMYLVGTDTIGTTTNGVLRSSTSASSITNTIPIYQSSGAIGTPSYAFSSDNTTGAWFSSGKYNISVGGSLVGELRGSGLGSYFSNGIYTDNGGAAVPSISFNSRVGDGIYSPALNELGFSTASTARLNISTTINPLVAISLTAGSAASPILNFGGVSGDSNTGIYWAAPDVIGFSTGGSSKATISSTTADFTSMNVSTSGKFIAGDGTTNDPSFTFSGVGGDCGMYYGGLDRVRIACSNSDIFEFNDSANNQNHSLIPFNCVAGQVSAPALTFDTSYSTGFYSSSSNVIDTTITGTRTSSFSATTNSSLIPFLVSTSSTTRFSVNTNNTEAENTFFPNGGEYVAAGMVTSATNAPCSILAVENGKTIVSGGKSLIFDVGCLSNTWSESKSALANANAWVDGTYARSLNLMVVVSSSANTTSIATSSGGSWTTRTSSASQTIRRVCWSERLGIFVASGTGSSGSTCISSSTDGITWTTRSNGIGTIDGSDVCYSPYLNMFSIACGSFPNGLYSTNGTTWSLNTMAATQNWRGTCWCPFLKVFVQVSSDGTNRAQTSSDGTTWTLSTLTTANTWRGVASSNNIVVAVANSGTSRVAYTYDCVTWTAVTIGTEDYTKIKWHPFTGFIVSGGASPNDGYQSFDGVTWTSFNSGTSATFQTSFYNDYANTFWGTVSGSTSLYSCQLKSGIDLLSVGDVASSSLTAALEVNSTTKGMLPPRMTSSQKDAISSPTTGLVVYDSDLATLSSRSTTKQGCVVSVRISNLALTSNVVTVTLYSQNVFSAGDTFQCIGLTNASWTFLNYKYLTITSISGNDCLASYTNANVGSTSITVGTVNGVHLYNSAAATWNAIASGSTQPIYYDNFQAVNTLTWSSAGTINQAVGIIASDSVDGRQITWKSPFTFATGNYMLQCGMQGFTDKGLVSVTLSQDNGSTYPIILISGLNQYTNALYYQQYPLMYFTITTSCTPWINWAGQGKMSVSSSYSYTIMAPFVIYRLS